MNCVLNGCEREQQTRGLCRPCYLRARKAGTLDQVAKPAAKRGPQARIPICCPDKKHEAQGLCLSHYRQKLRGAGKPTIPEDRWTTAVPKAFRRENYRPVVIKQPPARTLPVGKYYEVRNFILDETEHSCVIVCKECGWRCVELSAAKALVRLFRHSARYVHGADAHHMTAVRQAMWKYGVSSTLALEQFAADLKSHHVSASRLANAT